MIRDSILGFRNVWREVSGEVGVGMQPTRVTLVSGWLALGPIAELCWAYEILPLDYHISEVQGEITASASPGNLTEALPKSTS